MVRIKNGTILDVITEYPIGTLIKFKYQRLDEERFSYSKVERVIPKIENLVVSLYYLTENKKYISEKDIVSIEKEASNE